MLQITTRRESYAPGESIEVDCKWQCDKAISEVRLSLLWFTEGKGTQDITAVEKVNVGLSKSGGASHSFVAPKFPYSYHGTLLSIVWAVELTIPETAEFTRRELIIAPDSRAVGKSSFSAVSSSESRW